MGDLRDEGINEAESRAPVTAESATRNLLRVVEHPAVPEGTAYAVSVVEGPDGEKRLDAVKLTDVPAESAKRAPPISEAARRARDPLPPHVLVAALEEGIAPVTGRVIATKPLPAESATKGET